MSDNNRPQFDEMDSDASKRRPSLNLFVPPQAPPPPDSFFLDAKQTADWFESLPKANVGETARRIYKALVDFNRMELPPVLRARNAEQFREPVDYICRNLQRHFVDTGFPLSEKGQKAAALARALQQEMAVSYKAIVQDLLAGHSERFDKKLLVISLHRAARYIDGALLQACLVYGPWPPGLWREIHSLYAYAWQNSIHQVQVREGQTRNSPQSTLENAYIKTLLFAAATPHRLRQGQQLALAQALPEWSRHVRLGPADELTSGFGQFQVDLFSDSPPMRDAPDAPAASRRLRNLDLQSLIKHMRKLFDATPWQGGAGSDTRGNALSRQLLRTVLHSWGSDHERRFVRTRLSFELTIVTGMNHLHNHLVHLRQMDDREGDTGDRYASSFVRPQDTTPIDPWSEPFSHGLSKLVKVEADTIADGALPDFGVNSSLPDSQPTMEPATGTAAGHSVRTVNESAGGYCIQWKGEGLPRVRIGELLGLQGNQDAQEFGVGTIRWIRLVPNQPLQFGVELLAPQCLAGEVTPAGDARKQYPRTPQRCLVIPAPSGADNGCIILPSALYAVGTTLKLQKDDQSQQIRLSQVVETTGAYARYQFDDDTPQSAGEDPQKASDDFDDLWGNL